jgi:hypothetical protein
MDIPRGDVMYLLRRDEMVGLLGRDLTTSEWTKAKRMLYKDRELWDYIDDTLMMIVDEIRKEKI